MHWQKNIRCKQPHLLSVWIMDSFERERKEASPAEGSKLTFIWRQVIKMMGIQYLHIAVLSERWRFFFFKLFAVHQQNWSSLTKSNLLLNNHFKQPCHRDGDATKKDFRNKFQSAFDPLPSFSENHVQILFSYKAL